MVNIVSEEIAEQMNLTSGEYPYGADEFEISGLTPVRAIWSVRRGCSNRT